VGLDHHGTRNGSETRELVLAHMRALRARPCMANARFVLVPEENLGNEAQEIAEAVLREISGVEVLARTDDRYGVRTDQDAKRKYVFRFADMLARAGDGALTYHEPLTSASPFVSNRSADERATEARTEFERQLRSFRRFTDLAPSLTSLPRVVYTGKADDDKKNTARMRDDMVLAALIGFYWSAEYLGSRITAHGYTSRHERAHAPPIAPVVRHVEFGGEEFAARAGVVAPSSSSASLETRLQRATLKRQR